MKLMVTGGCGFIGSNFLNLAFNHNFESILNIDSLTYAADEKNVNSENQSNYKFRKIDITNRDKLELEINSFKPDVIVHFAAESHVDNSIVDSYNFVNTNVMGTYNLIEISREYIEKNNIDNFHFIHISTDEVFGDLSNKGFFSEKTPYNPSSPYSASKASSDHLVNAWIRTYNFPATILNCSNNFGPGQHSEKLIPTIILNSFNNNKIPVYGDGSNVRETNVPSSAGTNVPENENPRTVLFPVDVENPASAAAPPKAPVSVTPLIANWKPYRSTSEL